jgi:hypothetical protein
MADLSANDLRAIEDVHNRWLEFERRGDSLASSYATSYVPANSFEIENVRGSHLWILHRLENGGWKVAVVTWSMFEI